jgi:hypothetical protein
MSRVIRARRSDPFNRFYGPPKDDLTGGWRELSAFNSCMLQPLEWAGLIQFDPQECGGIYSDHVFKTPLWLSALKLDTDDMLKSVQLQ